MKATPKIKGINTRRNMRAPGPFNARWKGALDAPLVIHDLSAGGCMIRSSTAKVPPDRLRLDIELAPNDWVTVSAELRYQRPRVGFAVAFCEVPPLTTIRIERRVAQLLAEERSAERSA